MRFDRTAWHPINVSQLIVRTGGWTLITAVLCFALIGFSRRRRCRSLGCPLETLSRSLAMS